MMAVEILAIVGLSAAFLLLAISVDLAELIADLLLRSEFFELDEILLALAFLGIVLAGYAIRLWRLEVSAREQRYSQLFRAASGAQLMADSQTGEIIDANDAACRLYGYTRDQLAQTRLVDLIRAPSAETVPFPFSANDSPFLMSAPHIRSSAEAFNAELTAFHTETALGSYVHVVVRDVTETDTLRSQLVAATDRFTEAIESIHEGFALFDSDDRLVVSNLSWRTMLGPVDPSDIVPGMTFEEVIRNDLKKGVIADAVGREEAWLAERMARHRNPGGPFLIHRDDGACIEAREHRATDGAMIAVLSDVTEQHRQEQELRAKEAQIRLLFENSNAGIAVANHRGRLLDINDAFLRMLGYDRPELLGRLFDEITVADDIATDRGLFEKLITGQIDHYEIEKRYIAKDSSIIWATLSVASAQLQGADDLMIIAVCHDITARKLAEQALEQSQEHLRQAMRVARTCLWDADLVAGEVWWSREFEALLGYEPNELFGRAVKTNHWEDHLHDEDRDRVLSEVDDHLNGLKPDFTCAYRMVKKDGGLIWIEATGKAVRDDQGVAVRLGGTMTDITARQGAEEDKRRAEQRLAVAISRLDEAFALWDADDRLVICNDRFRRCYPSAADLIRPGVRFEDVVRHSVGAGDFVLDEPAESWIDHLLEQHREGGRSERQLTDGRWLSVSDSTTTDGGSVGVRSDITPIKQAEIRSANDHAVLLSLINAVPDLIFFKDTEGRYLGCNRAFEELAGRDNPNIIGLTDFDLFSPENVKKIVERDRQIFDGDETRRFEEIAEYPDGRRRIIDTLKTPLRTPDGKRMGLIGVSRDVTDQKRIEAELLQAKEAAEAAGRAKSEFLAKMSHELRTPLTGILGVTDLLLRSDLSESQRRSLEMLGISGRSLISLVNSLLDLSKVEAGELTLEVVDFDLQRVLDEVGWLLDPKASKKGLGLTLPTVDERTRWLRGDPLRFREILINLIDNALKFTEKGSVSVRCRPADMPANGGDIEIPLRFEVADTGIGIAADNADVLFEPFSQAESSTTRRYGGTGLGLAICKQLVGLMGGEISVLENDHGGSTFWFTAVFQPGNPEAAQKAASDTKIGVDAVAPMRVLLVEDNEINRELLGDLLRRSGHTVESIDNGRAAVEAIRNDDYDVVLMDVHMPEMDGITATRLVRLMPPPKGLTPIVALTADAMPAMRKRVLAAGFDDMVAKPIDLLQLDACLARIAATAPRQDAPVGAAPEPAHDRPSLTAPSFGTVPLVDHQRVAALTQHLGEDKVNGLIEKLTARLPHDIHAMRSALDDGDHRAVAHIAHSLKGAAGLLGLQRVMAISEAIQDISGNRDRVRGHLAALEGCLPALDSEAV